MTREEREAELRNLLTTQRGKEEILAILKHHAGMIDQGNLPPFGTLLIETILNYEYPPGEAHGEAKPISQPREPGDVKFEAPPGQEAPGG